MIMINYEKEREHDQGQERSPDGDAELRVGVVRVWFCS